MKHFLLPPVFVALSTVVALAECPAPPNHSGALANLINDANSAETEAQGKAISSQMWELWADAPDAAAQAILDRGMGRRSAFDLLGAIADFDTLVAYCPDYAEGYNQRAFANFLQGNFARAEVDLRKAIELSPNHVAARAGLALTYMQMDRVDEARAALEAALKLNPWLSERHLIGKGGPLAPKGQDI